MKFNLQNCNDFKSVSWHDYFSIIVNEFAILLIRKYDWPDHPKHLTADYTFTIQILGFTVYQHIEYFKEKK